MWSPRELAELASTSRRTVRHYHDLGLLPVPERASNGYLRYDVHHLVRLLRVRRLVELGLSLPDIAALGDDLGHPAEALRTLHEEIGTTIDRLRRTRADVESILAEGAPSELPLALAAATAGLSDADRLLMAALSRLLSAEAIRAYADLQSGYIADDAVERFNALRADASAAERLRVADALSAHWSAFSAEHEENVRTVNSDLESGTAHRRRTIGRIVQQLYNPAQLEVLARVQERAGIRPYYA